MKVVLDADPIKFPLTGIGRYTYELALGLRESGLEDVRFLVGNRLRSEPPREGRQSRPAWKRVLSKIPLVTAMHGAVSPRIRGLALRGVRDHVFHGPNYYLPEFAGRCVVTIHDLSVFKWPQYHPAERVRYMHRQVPLALARAGAIITDTEYTRHEVAEYFSLPIDRIHAVALASSGDFAAYGAEELRPVLADHGLTPHAYTLFTGTIEPRKNIGVLLDAYARLPETLRLRWPLVLVGYRGWASPELFGRIERARKDGWLKYLGFVPKEVLPRLMAGARLFAYPSRYEGFGLPVLEAMASGTPVVCSNASTLPEVAGDAAAFHDPDDVDALLELLERGLEDGDWRAAAIQRGMRRAALFSWQRCVAETIDVYRQVSAAP